MKFRETHYAFEKYFNKSGKINLMIDSKLSEYFQNTHADINQTYYTGQSSRKFNDYVDSSDTRLQ